jgi:hypothetical protein
MQFCLLSALGSRVASSCAIRPLAKEKAAAPAIAGVTASVDTVSLLFYSAN